jgi:hypothetical protein
MLLFMPSYQLLKVIGKMAGWRGVIYSKGAREPQSTTFVFLSRGHAEHALAPLRSLTHTTCFFLVFFLVYLFGGFTQQGRVRKSAASTPIEPGARL